jgi:hypothetical protein
MGSINFIRTYIKKHILLYLRKHGHVPTEKTSLQENIVPSRKGSGMVTV